MNQDLRRLQEIGHLLRTQDNRITEAPIFVVQQKQKTYGVDDGYTDLYDWCHKDGEGTADEVLAKRLNAKDRAGKSTGKWEKIGYVEHWEFVTACFTEQGCIDYLKRNGHNLHETRIYADGTFRNNEYRAVRAFLMGLPAPSKDPHHTSTEMKLRELARDNVFVNMHMRLHDVNLQTAGNDLLATAVKIIEALIQQNDTIGKQLAKEIISRPQVVEIPADPRYPADQRPLVTSVMKAACIGDFHVEVEHTCPHCYTDAPDPDCEVCKGAVTYTVKHQIPWTTMKDIYRAMAQTAAKEVADGK